MTTAAPISTPSLAKPLLSICVPTYNRAHLLRIMLQAALPQVKECGDLVELCVCDNASPDNTREVLEESRTYGPFQYTRNESNLGFHGNIVKLTTKLAQGEYVWLLGDDDLLIRGALARVIEILQANHYIDAFWANYRCAIYPDDWPEKSIGGYNGSFFGLNVNAKEDEQVKMWQEFLRHESGLCTAMFAHIVRRRVWVDYWEKRPIGPTAVRTMTSIFPHNVMFANALMRKPSYYIGQPVLTTFAGTQSYNDVSSEIWLFCYPQLLRLYHKKGLAGSQLGECARGVFGGFSRRMLEDQLRDESKPPLRTLLRFLRGGWRYAAAWKVLAQGVRKTGKPRLVDVMLGALAKVNRWFPLCDLWKVPVP